MDEYNQIMLRLVCAFLLLIDVIFRWIKVITLLAKIIGKNSVQYCDIQRRFIINSLGNKYDRKIYCHRRS